MPVDTKIRLSEVVEVKRHTLEFENDIKIVYVIVHEDEVYFKWTHPNLNATMMEHIGPKMIRDVCEFLANIENMDIYLQKGSLGTEVNYEFIDRFGEFQAELMEKYYPKTS